MPEPSSTPFEQALEADLTRLAQEVKSQRDRPEMKNAGERELLKEAIRSFPQMEKNPRPVPAPPAAAVPTPSAASQSPLPAYAQSAPAEVKLEIEYLLSVAFRDGLGKALTEAKKSSNFVEDAFHDALAGKLYPELKKQGLVK